MVLCRRPMHRCLRDWRYRYTCISLVIMVSAHGGREWRDLREGFPLSATGSTGSLVDLFMRLTNAFFLFLSFFLNMRPFYSIHLYIVRMGCRRP